MRIKTARAIKKGLTADTEILLDLLGEGKLPQVIPFIPGIDTIAYKDQYVFLGAPISNEMIEISYAHRDDHQLINIFIGLKSHGIIAQCTNEGWSNCYTHGNCGKNWASGGTWYSPSSHKQAKYTTLEECLKNRHNLLPGDDIGNRFISSDYIDTDRVIAQIKYNL